jgi:hypothetical protein
MYLEEGGEPGGAGRADNGHAHQVSDHARTPQQLHPVHAPENLFFHFREKMFRQFRESNYFPENVP